MSNKQNIVFTTVEKQKLEKEIGNLNQNRTLNGFFWMVIILKFILLPPSVYLANIFMSKVNVLFTRPDVQ